MTRKTSVPVRVLLALGILIAGPAPSAAREGESTKFYHLASGERGRTYYEVYAPRIIKLVAGFRIRNRETKGSVENLDLLAKGQADLGLAQLDIYALRVRAEPNRYGGLTVLGRLDDECIYLAYRRAGPVTTFAGLAADVGGRPAKVAVGAAGGGMSATWSNLADLKPGLAAAKVSNTGGALALNQLSLGMYDAVGWVTAPRNLDHVMLRGLNTNTDLGLLVLSASSLEGSAASGATGYEPMTVAINKDRPEEMLETLCTSAALFARPGAYPYLVEATSQVLSLERNKILGLEKIK